MDSRFTNVTLRRFEGDEDNANISRWNPKRQENVDSACASTRHTTEVYICKI